MTEKDRTREAVRIQFEQTAFRIRSRVVPSTDMSAAPLACLLILSLPAGGPWNRPSAGSVGVVGGASLALRLAALTATAAMAKADAEAEEEEDLLFLNAGLSEGMSRGGEAWRGRDRVQAMVSDDGQAQAP
jgi:hypothetical protein